MYRGQAPSPVLVYGESGQVRSHCRQAPSPVMVYGKPRQVRCHCGQATSPVLVYGKPLVCAERELYRKQVADAKLVVVNTRLGPNPPCSKPITMHYSFDFAQQVHYPSDPLQPGPIYFLTPRKCGIFCVCCEGVPQQVNYLIDEGMATSKGSDAVISYLHHFLGTYGLGEESVTLHCDNCSGQNKNRYMLFYFIWRTMRGLHRNINLNSMVVGHTKFAPDWCFGLLKQKYRRTSVSCLDDIVQLTNNSTTTGVNLAHLVGTEEQTVNASLYN